MAHPRGESGSDAVRLDFDRRLMLQFRGSLVTSDAGRTSLLLPTCLAEIDPWHRARHEPDPRSGERLERPLRLPCSPAVIGRCSQCALVSVDRATVSRARQKCRSHPTMDRPPVSPIGLDGWPFDPKYPVYRRDEAGFGRNSIKPID
jgi:hypothetical protein